MENGYDFRIRKYINRASRHLLANDFQEREDGFFDNLVKQANKNYEELNYNFSNYKSNTISQNGKKRVVYRYENVYSTENILSYCIKYIIDRTYKIKYPNRNNSIRSLFQTLSAVKNMSDFTIVKFDFKDYFNSVSTPYVFEKMLIPKLRDRSEIELIWKFSEETKYSYAGLCTSNAFAEIIGIEFDRILCSDLKRKGLLYHDRYVDDSIFVLNEYVTESDIKIILDEALANTFNDQKIQAKTNSRVRFNEDKFIYISSRNNNESRSIDYLGYEFYFNFIKNKSIKLEIEYGITEEKRCKYQKRLNDIIESFTRKGTDDYQDIELLRHRIAGFTCRTVYLGRYYKSNVWKVKGIISNYGELRGILDTELLHHSTKNYLKNMVANSFQKMNEPLPYFITGSKKRAGYNLFYNMKANKTILLVEQIGFDLKSLSQLCKSVGILLTSDDNVKQSKYDRLVREYLIRIRIGY